MGGYLGCYPLEDARADLLEGALERAARRVLVPATAERAGDAAEGRGREDGKGE
jgi:hypothetical protein